MEFYKRSWWSTNQVPFRTSKDDDPSRIFKIDMFFSSKENS